jgi:raffinose/stachyose/melibiose transport system substrate-binding protein
MPVDESAVPDGLPADVFAAWKTLDDADGLIPYLDYTTPTFFDDISGAIQRLLGGKDDPEQFVAGVQDQFSKFTESQQ